MPLVILIAPLRGGRSAAKVASTMPNAGIETVWLVSVMSPVLVRYRQKYATPYALLVMGIAALVVAVGQVASAIVPTLSLAARRGATTSIVVAAWDCTR